MTSRKPDKLSYYIDGKLYHATLMPNQTVIFDMSQIVPDTIIEMVYSNVSDWLEFIIERHPQPNLMCVRSEITPLPTKPDIPVQPAPIRSESSVDELIAHLNNLLYEK